MSGLLKDKSALITGGSEGIGFATAERFIKEGASVVFITGRRAEPLQDAASKLGGKAVPIIADSSRAVDLDHVFNVIREKKFGLDVLFVNAGISKMAPLGAITEDSIDSQYSVNVKGVVLTVQKAIPLISDGGAIVMNASVGGSVVVPGGSIYASTKAAVIHLAKTWSAELKSKRIRVNTVSPGPIETPMLQSVGEEAREMFASKISLGRIGRPDEIASAVTFLVSQQASFINAIDLRVDGGYT